MEAQKKKQLSTNERVVGGRVSDVYGMPEGEKRQDTHVRFAGFV